MPKRFITYSCILQLILCLTFLSITYVSAKEPMPSLPSAISNNATSIVMKDDGYFRLYSFFGLGEGKTWRDVSKRAYEYQSRTNTWRELASPPVTQGRLASVAVSAEHNIYLLGGYTVSEKGEESSTPDVLSYDSIKNTYSQLAPMPVPVDDSVAVVYQERWIILVSGWHEKDNVSLVQVYDRLLNTWNRTTDWPGKAVFGHAAALYDDALLVCDGVTLTVTSEGKRHFDASNQCWRGDITVDNSIHIRWTSVPPHPGKPRYRMAANAIGHHAYFAGGSENPYNFNGIGYNDVPSQASDVISVFDFDTNTWLADQKLPVASMDHRALPCNAQSCFLIGGMRNPQAVSKDVVKISVDTLIQSD